MEKTNVQVDWMWVTNRTVIDNVYVARNKRGAMVLASNPEFDCLIIGDTPEDLRKTLEDWTGNSDSFGESLDDMKPEAVSLFGLSQRFRWFVHDNKVRFLLGGSDWVAGSLAESPVLQPRLAPDPATICFYAVVNDNPLTQDGALIIEKDVVELLDVCRKLSDTLDEADMTGISFRCTPLSGLLHMGVNEVWFMGRKHNVMKSIARNRKLTAFMMGLGEDLNIEEGGPKE